LYAGGSVWLKQWAEVNGEEGKNPNVGKYIGIYFAFGIGSASLVVVQTLILWIFCSIEVSADGSVHHADADADATTERKLNWCPGTGIQKAPREDGFRYFQVPDELLRNVSEPFPSQSAADPRLQDSRWTNSEQILKVRAPISSTS